MTAGDSALTAHRGWAIDDDARLSTLADFDLAQTQAEPDFDAIAAAASELCETPVGLVTVLGKDHQWFKAKVGTDFTGTPISVAICTHTLASGDTLVIPDLAVDARTAANPLVTDDPKVRFYAGVPLVLDGQASAPCACSMSPRAQAG